MLMTKEFSMRAISHARNRRQAYMLLLLGIICLLAAWLLHPNTGIYPIGVMVFGVGMLIASIINLYRLMIASLLVTLLGIAVFLFYKHIIPGNQVFPVYIIAMALGLLGIALMVRRGYVGAGAVTPGLLVLVVGIIEYLLVGGYSIGSLTPDSFTSFMLSLWLPGIGLIILGLIYFLTSARR
jgi:hypothetical protein